MSLVWFRCGWFMSRVTNIRDSYESCLLMPVSHVSGGILVPDTWVMSSIFVNYTCESRHACSWVMSLGWLGFRCGWRMSHVTDILDSYEWVIMMPHIIIFMSHVASDFRTPAGAAKRSYLHHHNVCARSRLPRLVCYKFLDFVWKGALFLIL